MLRQTTRIHVAVLGIITVLSGACTSRVDQAALQAVQAGTSPASGVTALEEAGGAATPATSGGISEPAVASAGPAAAASTRPKAVAPSSDRAAAAAQPSAASSSASGGPTPAAGPAPAGTSGGSFDPKTGAGPGIQIPENSSQGVTDTEIKVGVLAPLSGYAGFLGEAEVDGVKAFLFDQNAKGGVNGRKYRILTADTRFESATEAVGARRLVEQEKVFFLFATFMDSIAPYVAAKGIPTAGLGVVPPTYSSKYPNVYPLAMHTVDAVAQMAYELTQVQKRPIKSVAILYGTANIPWGPWIEYATKAWEHFGVEVKSVDRFNLSDGDCTQLVLKIQSLKVDFWQIAQTLGWPLCQQAMARQGYSPPQGRGGPYTDDWNWLNQMGPAADGVYAQTNGVQLDGPTKGQPWPYDPSGVAPEVDHYIDSMEKYSPKSANRAGLNSIWVQSFWSQAKLLNDAVQQQQGSLTWKGVNQWIQSQTNWSSGLVSPGSFAPGCKTGGAQVWTYQVKWNAEKQSVEESDWKPYGGVHPLPLDVKNAIFPGAGDCYLTAMADAKL